MKQFYGTDTYVQSVGVSNDLEIDGFAIAVCDEIGVELSRHRSRSFDEMEEGGEPLSSFDLVVALTPVSQSRAEALARFYELPVEFWPISDPTGGGEARDQRLGRYRRTRDEIVSRLVERWGPPRDRDFL